MVKPPDRYRRSWEGHKEVALEIPPKPLQVPNDSLSAFTLLFSHFRDLLGKLQDSGSQEQCRPGLLAPFMSARRNHGTCPDARYATQLRPLV